MRKWLSAAGARRQYAPAATIRPGRAAAHVPDPEPDSNFVVTAYELQGKAALAYRRRRRRKR
jgi:hypothetical protein